MAKKEKKAKPEIKQEFADLAEARTAAVQYGSQYKAPKTGKESKWSVYEFPGGRYIVARSLTQATLVAVGSDEKYRGKRLRDKSIPAPREYVNYCDISKLEELLEAITERQDKLNS